MVVTSDMAGSVSKVLVNVGDRVKEGQEVAILESMKMEIPIQAVSSGDITEVKVSEGDFVNEGDILIVIQ